MSNVDPSRDTRVQAGGFNGEAFALVQAKDWSQTSLGPREEWSQSLRTLVDVVLAHPLPMILLWGPDLIQIYNDGCARIAGTAALGMSTRKCWPEVWQITGPIYERVMGRGESVYLEGSLFPLPRGEGSPAEDVYINVAYAPARDDAGQVAGILITIIETTGIAGTEAAQREAMARVDRQAHVFDTVLTHINDFAYIFDRDGRFLYVNKPLLDLWGLPLEQAVGKNFFDLKYSDDLAAKLQRQIQQVIDTKRVVVDETPYTSPSGKAGYYEYIFSPVFAGDGSVEVVAGSTRVITARKQLEVALKNERARLASVIEQAPAFICTLRGPEHVFEIANERYYEIAGRRDIIGKTVREVQPEVEGQGYLDILDRVYRTGEPFEAKEKSLLLRRGGDGPLEQRFINVAWQALREADGTVSGIFIHGVDVTDAVRSREALRSSEERYRRLIETAHEGIWTIDADGRTTYVNRRMAELLGYAPQEMMGRVHTDFMWEQDRPKGDVDMDSRRQGAAAVWDQRYRRRDGSELWTVASCNTLYDADGKFAGALGMFTDITDRKRAEEELRAQSAVTQTVTSNAAEALYLLDPDGLVTFANPAAEAMFGWTRQEMLGGKLHDLIHYKHPDDRPFPMADCTVGQCFASGQTLRNHEDVFVHRDGTFVPVLCSMSPISHAGQITGAVLAVIDITERKRAEEALRQAMEEAERASEAKSEFLATLSHELRTPLTPVLLTVSLMESHPGLPPELREDVATIRRNVELESRLISDLLDLTRITKGKLQLEQRPVDLHLIVRSAIDICQREASAKLSVDLAASCHIVRGDSTRLQQVFWNLINNAIKFTPEEGAITVRSRNADAGRIAVEVSDTGAGIDAALLPRLFNAFEQGEVRAERRHAGLGLGLAISKRLAEAHGGTITVASAGRGRGAAFTVDLPVLEQAGRKPTLPEHPTPRGAAAQPLNVLLVEDHEPTLRVMERLLRHIGHRVTGVTSVASATAAAKQNGFDLIISDLGLPDGSGLDVMRQLRHRYAGRAIALTGYGMESDVAASREAGFAEHLTKPVDLGALEATIARIAGPTNV